MIEFKICHKCKVELPIINFSKQTSSNDGYHSRCKACVKQHNKEHKVEIALRQKLRYEAKKPQILEYTKAYNEKHKDKKSTYDKQYYIDHKESALLYAREYKITHKGMIAHRTSNWQKFNKDKVNRISQRYRATKFLLPSNLTTKQWENIKLHFNNKCCYCNKELPLAQEHFLAVTKGGDYTLNNIIPSCQSCNSSKGNRNFFEWYPNNKSYNKKREKYILEFLHYNNGNQQLAITV